MDIANFKPNVMASFDGHSGGQTALKVMGIHPINTTVLA